MAKKKPVKASKKPAKPAPKAGLGAALKKAVKTVAKKISAPAKKPAKPAKKAQPAAAKKVDKKVTAKPIVAAKTKVSASAKKVLKPVPLVKKTAEKPVVEPKKGKGKKGQELVLEVPASKGVAALVGRDGKKRGRSLEAGAGRKRCREPGCEQEILLVGYCRLHYIKNWRKIKRKEAILASGQLNNYVEELVHKYPDKYLEVIRQDLASEKDWAKVVVDLELDSGDEDAGTEEDSDAVPENVGSRREFDDDSDTF
jgi:hypothetical protein